MIAPTVVVAAAHCFEVVGSQTNSSGSVTLDVINYYDPDDVVRPVYSGIATWFVPETYDGAGPSGPTGSDDDVAIMIVPERFTRTDYHDYLRIYAGSDALLSDAWLWAYGAGYYSFNWEDDSMLRTAKFEVAALSAHHVVVDTSVGAGVCFGDSGGPLVKFVRRQGMGVPTVVGVLSKMQRAGAEGPACGASNEGDDNAYYCRTGPSRVAWIENLAGISCGQHLDDSNVAYMRCFDLPFIEDVPGEGLELGVATAIFAVL